MDDERPKISHQAYLEFVKAIDGGDTKLEQEAKNAADPANTRYSHWAYYYNCWAYEKRIPQFRALDANGPLNHFRDHHISEISNHQDRADAIKAMEQRTLQFEQKRSELNKRYDRTYILELNDRVQRRLSPLQSHDETLYHARHQLAHDYHRKYEDLYDNLTKDLVQILDHGIEFSRQRSLETKRLFEGMRHRDDDRERER